jgi:hypothetical protein
LRHVREYLGDRIDLVRKELDVLRAADGGQGNFSPVIGLLETALEQVAGAAGKVMDDADAALAVAAVPGKIDLASSLMGSVARSHRAAAFRRAREEGAEGTNVNPVGRHHLSFHATAEMADRSGINKMATTSPAHGR